MASTNQDNANKHSLAAQHQHQELIKLLTHHFHHQFYQLAAANNTTNGGHQFQSSGSHQMQPPLVSYQQQQQSRYPSEAALLGAAGVGLDLNSIAANKLLLHEHILRSQTSNNTGTNLSNSLMNPDSSLSDHFSGQASGLNPPPYAFNDMNFLNALGLNLTNNQLVLSLHQQSLFQAANARQYELRNQLAKEQHCDRLNTNTEGSNLNEHEDNHHDGKEMLKFSINTILGKDLPNLVANKVDMIKRSNQDFTIENAKSYGEQTNNLFRTGANRNLEPGALAECDLIESGSDSNSMDATPPIPQASTSILFNQAEHRSANMSAGSSLSLPKNHPQNLHHQSNHRSMPFLAASSTFPWTVAARGKPRRGMMRRAVFSDSQRVGLEKRFQLQKYISKPDRKKLAEKLGLRDSQVKIWFQNRRMKWRNSKERELLSTGGSREQTLPTRNNPNPDLSDVGETIKRLTVATNNSGINAGSSPTSTNESINQT